MLKNDENDDKSVMKVDDDKDETKKLPDIINFYFEAFCNSDDSSWSVDDSPYLTEGDLDIPLCSKVIKDDPKNNTKILKKKEKITTTSKTLENNFSDEKNLGEFRTEEKSNFTIPKKLKRFQYGDIHNSKISNIDEMNLLDINLKTRIGENSNETNSVSIINNHILHNLIENSTDIPGPSCSKNLTSLPDPCNSSKSLDLPDSFNANLSGTFSYGSKKVPKYFLEFYKESILKDTLVPMKVPEDIEVMPLKDCDYVQSMDKSMGLENDDENLDLEEESNDLVDDPDIINPEITYNIDLNEHYKLMDILVQQISETPDDLTVLDECMKLPPIPQVEHQPRKFTSEERLMFMNGCSKWEYKIDRDDWTKIMVKRAVIFTAHAGFAIANEESLYVLADVIIDYIKKFAVVMKKNFDIQSNSSCSTSIDPINLSLQEMGVEGGIKEVMQHYKNDIFDRREKLMNKCQHLQKVIDQYVGRMQHDNRISNQYVTNENFVDETLANEILQNDDNVPTPDIINETESIVEVNAEFQSLLEEVQNESQPITEENISNIELELTEPICIASTSEFESIIGSSLRGIECVKTNVMEIKDQKINNTKSVATKIKELYNDNTDLYNELLKPITVSEEDQIKETKDYKYHLMVPRPIDKEEILREFYPSGRMSYAERLKTGKLLDYDESMRLGALLFPSKVVEHDSDSDSDIDPEERKFSQKDLEDGFKLFQNSLIESGKSSNDAGSSQTDKNVVQNNSKPIQTVFVSDNRDTDETNFMDTSNIICNVPVTDNNLNVSDNDLVSMQPKSFSD